MNPVSKYVSCIAILTSLLTVPAGANSYRFEDMKAAWQVWKCSYYAGLLTFPVSRNDLFDEALELVRDTLPQLKKDLISHPPMPDALFVPYMGPTDDFAAGRVYTLAHEEAEGAIWGEGRRLRALAEGAVPYEIAKERWTQDQCEGMHAYVKAANIRNKAAVADEGD